MNEVYNIDCMEYMRTLPDKAFDLAIVDPPYGINIGTDAGGQGSVKSEGQTHSEARKIRVGGLSACRPKTYKAFDDSHTPDADYFEQLKRVAKRMIIWGGNYFLDFLGATECLIVWDKRRRGLNFADCEIAWSNIKQPCRIYEFKWNGMLQENMKDKEERIHPTQKPVALYKWLLSKYAKAGDKILDTHVGSGSIRIACDEMGYDFIGCEIDKDYWEAQEKRYADWKKGAGSQLQFEF